METRRHRPRLFPGLHLQHAGDAGFRLARRPRRRAHADDRRFTDDFLGHGAARDDPGAVASLRALRRVRRRPRQCGVHGADAGTRDPLVRQENGARAGHLLGRAGCRTGDLRAAVPLADRDPRLGIGLPGDRLRLRRDPAGLLLADPHQPGRDGPDPLRRRGRVQGKTGVRRCGRRRQPAVSTLAPARVAADGLPPPRLRRTCGDPCARRVDGHPPRHSGAAGGGGAEHDCRRVDFQPLHLLAADRAFRRPHHPLAGDLRPEPVDPGAAVCHGGLAFLRLCRRFRHLLRRRDGRLPDHQPADVRPQGTARLDLLLRDDRSQHRHGAGRLARRRALRPHG